jgi:hydrogenase-4 component F
MSGVLLSVAFYAILRVQAVSAAALGPAFMRGLLVAAGLLSLAVAAGLMLAQRDYKRLLAYSSIEHMGLLALGAAAGGVLATAAVLLHVLGHGLAKAAVFVVAGRILRAEGSSRIDDVHDLLARRPDLGVPFLTGMAALLGFPPFVLFFTEVAIVLAGWQRGLGWAMATAVGLLLVVFAGLGRHVLAMTVSAGPGSHHPRSGRPAPGGPTVPVALALGLTAVLGFAAWPLSGVLADAVAALGVPR